MWNLIKPACVHFQIKSDRFTCSKCVCSSIKRASSRRMYWNSANLFHPPSPTSCRPGDEEVFIRSPHEPGHTFIYPPPSTSRAFIAHIFYLMCRHSFQLMKFNPLTPTTTSNPSMCHQPGNSFTRFFNASRLIKFNAPLLSASLPPRDEFIQFDSTVLPGVFYSCFCCGWFLSLVFIRVIKRGDWFLANNSMDRLGSRFLGCSHQSER